LPYPPVKRLGVDVELLGRLRHANRFSKFDGFHLVFRREFPAWGFLHFGFLSVDKLSSTYPSEKSGLVQLSGYLFAPLVTPVDLPASQST
jgi:hypothetical protein